MINIKPIHETLIAIEQSDTEADYQDNFNGQKEFLTYYKVVLREDIQEQLNRIEHKLDQLLGNCQRT